MEVGGINGSITAKDYLQCYGLGNKLVEAFIEDVVAETVAGVGERAI